MKLSNFSKLSFGIGALGKDLCYAIISYFLMIYFTDTIGLTPLFVVSGCQSVGCIQRSNDGICC